MTTFAPHRDERALLEQLEERVRRAWTAYQDSLRDLDGRAYEEAEARSWDRLQRKLRQLDDERAALAGLQAPPV